MRYPLFVNINQVHIIQKSIVKNDAMTREVTHSPELKALK